MSKRSSMGGSKSSSSAFLLAQMLMCVAGIYVCFGWWSVMQERIMTKPYFPASGGANAASKAKGEMMPTVFGIGLSQTTVGAAAAAVLLVLQSLFLLVKRSGSSNTSSNKKNKRNTSGASSSFSGRDMRELIALGFSNAFGTSLGYAAMRRLSFPVVLSMKMSKMLPVMIVGFIWHKTRYPWRKIAACMMITGGILVFYQQEEAAKQQKKASVSSRIGFVLLFVNLVMDGFTNSTQDVLVKRRKWSGTRLMFWTNLVSSLWVMALMAALEYAEPAMEAAVTALTPLLADSRYSSPVEAVLNALEWSKPMIAFEDLSITAAFLQKYPEALRDVASMSMLNALGQLFIFHTIALFGTLTLTAMTLLRKAGSVVLSIFVHGHKVNSVQWGALGVILLGVLWEGYMNVAGKSKHSSKAGTESARAQSSSKSAAAKKKKMKKNSNKNVSNDNNDNNNGSGTSGNAIEKANSDSTLNTASKSKSPVEKVKKAKKAKKAKRAAKSETSE